MFQSSHAKTASGAIWWITGGYLSIGLHVWFVWMLTRDEVWIRLFFDYGGTLFFVGMAGLEWYLAFLCCGRFFSGEPLRGAWRLISISAACRLVGMTLTQVYAVPSGLNPYLWLDPAFMKAVAIPFGHLGMALSGPIHMLFLAVGIGKVLLVYRRTGLGARLKWIDGAALVLVLGFTLRQGYELLAYGGQPFTFDNALKWMTDPLLSLLLVEAILLRSYVLKMSGGGIARCWGAYAAAIFATSLGSISMWATTHEYLAWPLNSLSWYIWFFVSAAYAMAPAYQLEMNKQANEHARRTALYPRLQTEQHL